MYEGERRTRRERREGQDGLAFYLSQGPSSSYRVVFSVLQERTHVSSPLGLGLPSLPIFLLIIQLSYDLFPSSLPSFFPSFFSSSLVFFPFSSFKVCFLSSEPTGSLWVRPCLKAPPSWRREEEALLFPKGPEFTLGWLLLLACGNTL